MVRGLAERYRDHLTLPRAGGSSWWSRFWPYVAIFVTTVACAGARRATLDRTFALVRPYPRARRVPLRGSSRIGARHGTVNDMTYHEIDTTLRDAWTPPPNGTRQRRSPWWVPLLVPAVMTVLFVIGSIGDNGRTETERYTLAGDTFAWLFVLATLVAPAFYAGVRYNRQRGKLDPR